MVKVRLEGLPEEIAKYIEDFKRRNEVLQESKPYKNRNSKYVRVYLDIENKK
ncbi:DUF3970 family protein [Clostridium thailandense]|uniref:DUF3970 family protein n=1 Tax=Clostridium thailandense TaxID=2794346 RepID=UPI003989A0E4